METVAITYRAKPGSRIPPAAVQMVGEELQRLAGESGDTLTAATVVAAASNERSALHPYFEWNDRRAAQRWREHQARNLINSITVVVEDRHQRPQEVRAFHVVRLAGPHEDEETAEQAYVPIDRIRSDFDLSAQVIQMAREELEGWARRYEQYRLVLPEFESRFGSVFSLVKSEFTKSPDPEIHT